MVEHHQQRSLYRLYIIMYAAVATKSKRRLRVDMHHGIVTASIGTFQVQQISVKNPPMGIAPVYPALQESFALWSVVQTVAAIAGSE